MKILKAQVTKRAGDMKPQELSNALWALARLGHGPEGCGYRWRPRLDSLR